MGRVRGAGMDSWRTDRFRNDELVGIRLAPAGYPQTVARWLLARCRLGWGCRDLPVGEALAHARDIEAAGIRRCRGSDCTSYRHHRVARAEGHIAGDAVDCP